LEQRDELLVWSMRSRYAPLRRFREEAERLIVALHSCDLIISLLSLLLIFFWCESEVPGREAEALHLVEKGRWIQLAHPEQIPQMLRELPNDRRRANVLRIKVSARKAWPLALLLALRARGRGGCGGLLREREWLVERQIVCWAR
jgi:hypothetical protein|tara:strand:- start:516 stop:950 length:435 start_codon:yes stop_codon:yes gene_type:complete